MLRVVLLLLLTAPSLAEAKVNLLRHKAVTVRGFLETPSYAVSLDSRISSSKVRWEPNLRALSGVDFSIRGFLGFGYGFIGNEDPQARDKNGRTTYSDYRLGATFPSWQLTGNLQTYRGLFISNSSDVDPSYAGSSVNIQDPTFQVQNLSVNFTYIFDPDSFSLQAAIDQSARQEESGGSWLAGLATSDTRLISDRQLIPTAAQSGYGSDGPIRSAHFDTFTVKGGYGYTIAWTPNFFTSVLLNIGIGYGRKEYDNGTQYKTGSFTASKGDALFSIGYNSDSFIASLVAIVDSYTFSTDFINLPTSLVSSKLAIGTHF